MRAEDIIDWPDDFIPEVRIMDETMTAKRFNFMSCLDRRHGDARNVPFDMTLPEFITKLKDLRGAAVAWGRARLEEYFVKRMNARFTGEDSLRVNERPIRSVKDFNYCIKEGTWNDTTETVVTYAQKGLWDNNSWAVDMENEFCRMMGIKFNGERCDGTVKQRNHDGKCFAKLFVKGKGTLVDSIRAGTMRTHKIGLYTRRRRFTKEGEHGQLDKDNRDSALGTKKIKNAAEIMRFDVADDTHTAYCRGHPSLGTTISSSSDSTHHTISSSSDSTHHSNDEDSTTSSPGTEQVADADQTNILQQYLVAHNLNIATLLAMVKSASDKVLCVCIHCCDMPAYIVAIIVNLA